MILKILTAKALFASATIGVSGVALAATGTLPAPVQNAVAAVTSQVGIHLPDGGSDTESRAGSSGVSGVTGEHNFSGAIGVSGTTGPPSVRRADRALCHALVSGRGAERGAGHRRARRWAPLQRWWRQRQQRKRHPTALGGRNATGCHGLRSAQFKPVALFRKITVPTQH